MVKRMIIVLVILCFYQTLNIENCIASSRNLLASYYSVQSLKQEGTWKYSKGRCADGSLFKDSNFTAASRDFSLGSVLCITNLQNGKQVTVRVTDRINKRFAKTRIDLSQRAFSELLSKGESLDKGLIKVKVELLNNPR